MKMRHCECPVPPLAQAKIFIGPFWTPCEKLLGAGCLKIVSSGNLIKH